MAIGLFYTLLFRDVPFFWDTIQLASKQAHHFYEKGLFPPLLPERLDSGHPPFVGLYLAVVWMLLGKSLFISHLAFSPFIVLYIYFLIQISRIQIRDSMLRIGWVIILLSEPLFLSQTAIMSPDIILISGMLGLYFAYLRHHRFWMLTSAIILAAVSLRGAMVLFAFCLVPIIYNLWYKRRGLRKTILNYIPLLPGVLLFLCFLGYHYMSKSWVGFHGDSPWAGSFSRVDAMGLLKNVGLFLYRWVESGKIFVLLSLLFLGWKIKNRIRDGHIFNLILLGVFSIVILINTLPYAHLNANRYFWPIYMMSFILLASFLDAKNVALRRKLLLLAVIFIHQTCIHFSDVRIPYSHDWEVSLIHLPYHSLQKEAMAFLREKGIPLDLVGTAFPAINSEKHIYLSDEADRMQDMRSGEFPYIYYSNIMNTVKSDQRLDIKDRYTVIWQKKSGRIQTMIYRRK